VSDSPLHAHAATPRELSARIAAERGGNAFLLYRDGEEIGRLAGGDVTFDKMRSWVDDTLSSATV
jgi:hypothetical protein